MVRGFYQLGSGIMSQSKVLSTISNNVANSQTVGFKKKVAITSTFGNILLSRSGSEGAEIGSQTLTNVIDETATIHSEGSITSTDRNLDFAIKGEGFFGLAGQNGPEYTRNGSFNLDEQGYLIGAGNKRVLGTNGQPIYIGTDNFTCNGQGVISVNGQQVGQIAVFTFNDYAALMSTQDGIYTAQGAELKNNTELRNYALEYSNVNMADEMMSALTAQRQLQSCSQALKMYDEVLDSATSRLGKL